MTEHELETFQLISILAGATFCVLVAAAYIMGGRAVVGVKAGLGTYVIAAALAGLGRVDLPLWVFVASVPVSVLAGIVVAVTSAPPSPNSDVTDGREHWRKP